MFPKLLRYRVRQVSINRSIDISYRWIATSNFFIILYHRKELKDSSLLIAILELSRFPFSLERSVYISFSLFVFVARITSRTRKGMIRAHRWHSGKKRRTFVREGRRCAARARLECLLRRIYSESV